MTGHCLCGAVRVTIDAKPAFIHDCNCSLCRKVGGAWSYFPSASVATDGATTGYVRRDKPAAGVEVHACATCATTTHFVLTSVFKERHPDADQVGVNMRLFDQSYLGGVEVRFPNGRDWPGEGAFSYRRAPLTISEATPW